MGQKINLGPGLFILWSASKSHGVKWKYPKIKNIQGQQNLKFFLLVKKHFMLNTYRVAIKVWDKSKSLLLQTYEDEDYTVISLD